MIQQYIRQFLKIGRYEILETEMGVIPMTDFPFHKTHQEGVTKIGTAGGWVKPSSGYAFKNTERFARMIVQNLVSGKPAHDGVASGRHRWYDGIFLDVLNRRNDLGPSIFRSMYTKVPTPTLFRFLDETSTVNEDLRVITSVKPGQFVKSFFRRLF